jgi:hypothetical protein
VEADVDVVVAGRIPVLDQLSVAVEHDDIARRQHILGRIGQIVDSP